MAEQQPQMLDIEDVHGKRQLAWLRTDATEKGEDEPGVLWLPGFNSVMTSSKATALAAWAAKSGRELTRFDYTGHGASGGRFEDGTIGLWLADCLAAFKQLTVGPQIVVGSSLGGYLGLLLAQELDKPQRKPTPKRLAGLVLIAPAWNMTERLMWANMSADARAILVKERVWLRPSEFGPPYPITRRLIEEGRKHLIDVDDLKLTCPLRVLHGQKDEDVPFEGSRELVEAQADPDARLIAIPDGDHRLARDQDIARLIREIEGIGG